MARLLTRFIVVVFAVGTSLTAAPVLATVSGQNGAIAFVSDADGDDDIYTMNPDGSDVVQITNAPDQSGFSVLDANPSWSPDGRSIAFERLTTNTGTPEPVERRDIWIMAADGSNQRIIVEGVEPTWSPDGRSIAFNMGSTGMLNGLPTSVIATVDLDTLVVRILTDPGTWVSVGGTSTSTDYSPTWTPDGSEIVFLRKRTPATPMSMYSDLMAVEVAGATTRSVAGSFGWMVWSVDYSPDSNGVIGVKMTAIQDNPPKIRVYDIDTATDTVVSLPTGYTAAATASFAPSGDRLVASLADSAAPNKATSIWTMYLDGSNPKELADGWDPVWQAVNPYPFGLVDASRGEWHLRYADSRVDSFYFGDPGDTPFMGDWDCNGVDTPGLYRQSDGYVYLRNANSQGNADVSFFFGNPGDVPVAGDFNGDGCDTVSLYRPANATFYIINELGTNDGGLGAAELAFVFGDPGDKPFVADFNGDGTDTPGLHRESTGLVYYRNTNSEGVADAVFLFGDPGDRLVANDWNLDGVDSVAVFRPEDTTAYVRFTNTAGNADARFMFGEPDWFPVTGTFALP